MSNRRLGPSSGKCSKCGRRISINPPRPCAFCAAKRSVNLVKQERVFTESEVRVAIERLIDTLPDTLAVKDYQRIRDVMSFPTPPNHIPNYD